MEDDSANDDPHAAESEQPRTDDVPMPIAVSITNADEEPPNDDECGGGWGWTNTAGSENVEAVGVGQ